MATKGIKQDRVKVDMLLGQKAVKIAYQVRKGEELVDHESAVFSLQDLPENIRTQVGLYGLSKLLQDRTSQFTSPATGGSKLIAFREMSSVYAVLASGAWSATRKGGGNGNNEAVLMAVLAETMGKPVAVIAAMWAKLPAEKRKEIAAKYADQVAAALAAADDDADDFFGDI